MPNTRSFSQILKDLIPPEHDSGHDFGHDFSANWKTHFEPSSSFDPSQTMLSQTMLSQTMLSQTMLSQTMLSQTMLSQILQLMSKSNATPAYKTVVNKAYPIKRQPKVAPETVTKRPSHPLNETQRSAFNVLNDILTGILLNTSNRTVKHKCVLLLDNFSFHELRSAYRLAVLKTHPDQGGSSETFQEVKKSYHILLALVKN